MTDMIERVARIMAGNQENYDDAPFLYDVLARAAIEAMRDPSDAMIEAGRDEFDDEQDADFLATYVYRAMIDAALKESGL